MPKCHETRVFAICKGVEGFITHIVVKSVLWYTVIVEGAGFGGNDPGDVRSQ